MAKCLFCERKSLFLRVNDEGYCRDCVPRVAARRKEEAEKRRKEEERRLAAASKAAEEQRLAEERKRIEEEYRKRHDEYGNHIGDYFTTSEVTVAGVTFKNGRRSRQTILRQIYWKDEPYQRVNKNKCIDLVATTYNDEPAVEVWVHHKQNREQIGYIPKEMAPFFHQNLYRLNSCEDFEVYGGGIDSDGERHSFGCRFTAKLMNVVGQGAVDSSLFDAFLYKKKLQSSTDKGDINVKLYKAFCKRYPHAWLIGCSHLPDSQYGLIIHLEDVNFDKLIYVKYDDDSNSALIEFSGNYREPELIKL